MKRIVVDFYAARNLGDDLFIKILVERYPTVEFIISAPTALYKGFVEERGNLKLLDNSKLQRYTNAAIEKLNRLSFKLFSRALFSYIPERRYKMPSDCYIHIGGSIFIEPPQNLKALNHRRRAKELSVLKHFATTPKIIIGANFGSYYSADFLEFYRSFFSKFNDICFRDHYSYSLFSKLPHIRFCPDIVFTLAGNYAKTSRTKNSYGFSVIDPRRKRELRDYCEGYITTICSTITRLINSGASVSLFSFCEIQGDMQAIEEILKRLPTTTRERVEVIGYGTDYNIDSFLRHYFSIENIFATRFHATILSIGARQNLLPIIYSEKTLSALKDLKYKGYYKHIERMKGDISAKLIYKITKNKNQTQSTVTGAEQHFSWLDTHLKP
ncbi:MAG: polysaccharide pyruvyl transferase family protein [Rikenellaceae bacterium]